ncbi:Sodium Bile acid symporter family protein [compost metagenome]
MRDKRMREFGLAFNRSFEKWMFLITPVALLAGILFANQLERFIEWVPYLFAYITLTMAMGCGLGQLREVAKRPGIMGLTFVLAHLISPLAAYGVGTLVFGANSPYVVGLVLFTIIPIGVSTVIWVGMSGGSVPLMLAMVVLDSALSPLVVPAGIQLFFGSSVEVKAGPIMLDLLLIIVLPTLIGVVLNHLTRGQIHVSAQPYTAPLSKFCFVTVIALNAAAIAPYLDQMKGDMLVLVPLVVVLVGICYALGYIGTVPLRNQEQQVTVSYATGMRNISLGIVLAMAYFSPLAGVPVVLSILVQQPLATVHHYFLQKINKSKGSVSA